MVAFLGNGPSPILRVGLLGVSAIAAYVTWSALLLARNPVVLELDHAGLRAYPRRWPLIPPRSIRSVHWWEISSGEIVHHPRRGGTLRIVTTDRGTIDVPLLYSLVGQLRDYAAGRGVDIRDSSGRVHEAHRGPTFESFEED